MKLLKKILFIPTITALLLLAACSNSDFQGNMDVKMQDFSYVNQDNKKVSLDDLKGTVWIADLIFTNCKTVCPPMTHNMTQLQQKLKEAGIKDYRIVSFSVDPENDTPEKLKEYIGYYEADESNWDLLTGYTSKDIKEFAEKSLKTLAVPEPDSDQVMHGTSFYLVDQKGIVVKSYSGYEDVPYDEIVLDMKTLINQK
ncbi:protein SCO1/2 [Oikeobacillus pervagus]|uniref:Protein SCO1/2 n=1 Tax=Oikeobacillus pervagus TaxID=1325931 RepID=A0AAJ1SXQ9_9BACI|nr:SCO family protein [Oikeobacillus pervagus]MDQ0214654.1 protein SCO1/2 [Oikeobacillus pervagus]